jgi:SAM-dependent methyltransferase
VAHRGTAGEYAPRGIPARLRDDACRRGALATLQTSLGWLGAYAAGRVRMPPAGTFTVDGEDYTYFHHVHRWTWLTERAVEIPIALRSLEASGERVLEVGNVLSHYVDVGHRVVDKYEQGPGVVARDVLEIEPDGDYDLILSISTIEHVGWDELPRDPAKALAAVDHLRGLLAPQGRLLLTLPVAYHPGLDDALRSGSLTPDRIVALRRDEKANRWRQVEPADVWDSGYDWLLYSALGLVVCEFGGPGGP